MRKSRQETAETRQRIVEAASAEFRRNGIDGTGLADLMGAAGLTHGGFYKHFESKDQVVEESLALAANSLAEDMMSRLAATPGKRGLQAVIDDYLSVDHLTNPAEGCPFVALASEVARSSAGVRQISTIAFRRLVDIVAAQIDDMPLLAAKKHALVILSTMIGALTMARVVDDADLSASILRQARKHLVRV